MPVWRRATTDARSTDSRRNSPREARSRHCGRATPPSMGSTISASNTLSGFLAKRYPPTCSTARLDEAGIAQRQQEFRQIIRRYSGPGGKLSSADRLVGRHRCQVRKARRAYWAVVESIAN